MTARSASSTTVQISRTQGPHLRSDKHCLLGPASSASHPKSTTLSRVSLWSTSTPPTTCSHCSNSEAKSGVHFLLFSEWHRETLFLSSHLRALLWRYSPYTMSSKPYNVGIIGYGLSAKIFHLPFILALPADFKFYAIVQRNPQPENDAQKDHPSIKSYRSSEELVKDEKVDIVVVTTGPETHFEITAVALKAGKHGMGIMMRFLGQGLIAFVQSWLRSPSHPQPRRRMNLLP